MLDAESIVAHDERDAAFALVMHNVHQALLLMRLAHYFNQTHGLGLENLPTERQFLESMNACAAAREKEKTP